MSSVEDIAVSGQHTESNARVFRKWKGVRLPYKKQGLIYFMCLNVQSLPSEIQSKILDMCVELAGDDCTALYEVLTCVEGNVKAVSKKYGVAIKRLYALRRMFYENWNAPHQILSAAHRENREANKNLYA